MNCYEHKHHSAAASTHPETRSALLQSFTPRAGEKTSRWVIWNLKVEGGTSEHLLHLAHYDVDTDNSESCTDVGKSVRSKREACWLLAVLYNMAAAH